MRDNAWLENKMWEMLHNNFADVPVSNDLVIKFGRRAKQRLGSIRRDSPPVKGRCRKATEGIEVRLRPLRTLTPPAPLVRGETAIFSRFMKSLGFSTTTPSSDVVGIHPSLNKEGKISSPSLITITGHFKDLKIPEYVVLATIAHELVHYAHGFSSPLEQKYQHPHRGGVVKKELEERGFGEIRRKADKWLKEEWVGYLKSVS